MSESGVDPERLRARALLLRELAQARAMLGRGPVPGTPTYPTDPLRWRQRIAAEIAPRSPRSGAA